jgi:hypothetical protein
MSDLFSPPRLHSAILTEPDHISLVQSELAKIGKAKHERWLSLQVPLIAPAQITIPLTAVTMNGNFDSYIYVNYKGRTALPYYPVVDSGNPTLILPSFADLQALPNFAADYQVLVPNAVEPWGCPAAIVNGPIEIPLPNGAVYEIPNCVFFACKGPNGRNQVTSNFGIGCITRWPVVGGVEVRSPLSYDPTFPVAEIQFAPVRTILAPSAMPTINTTSILTLYRGEPPGFRTFLIMPNVAWMALAPRSLTIGAVRTNWPGPNPALAMIDCGGGPAYLSDPNGFLYPNVWPQQVPLPQWAQTGSVQCQAVRDDLQIEVGDPGGSIVLNIIEGALPPAAQNLTLVVCRDCQYMMHQYGMNIGGISALFNRVLIDFAAKRVGFGAAQLD